MQVCDGQGGWQDAPDSYVPKAEVCNGLDDDCNGEADEGLWPVAAAEVRGECAGNVQVCTGAAGYRDAEDNYLPAAELCNGLDDDCNGDVDEGLDPIPADEPRGECADNAQVCTGDGGWQDAAANYVPTAEECNGLDDDCDGEADEGLDPVPADEVRGECAGNVRVCTGAGGYQDAPDNYAPAAETCNGLDDDCDGEVDNRPMHWGPTAQVTEETRDGARYPALAWNGDGYGLMWNNGAGMVKFRQLNAIGNPISEEIRYDGPGLSWYPTPIWTGARYAATWQAPGRLRANVYQVFFQRFDANGNPADDLRQITEAEGAGAHHPALAWSGDSFLVVWKDTRANNGEVFGRLLAEDGEPLGEELRLSHARPESVAMNPSVVWTGESFGIAWNETDVQGDEIPDLEAHIGVLALDGTVLVEDVLVSHSEDTGRFGGRDIEIAWHDGRFALAWYDIIEGHWQVIVALVDDAGIQLAPAAPVTRANHSAQRPALAASESGFGLAWYEHDDPEVAPNLMFGTLDGRGIMVGESSVVAASVPCCLDRRTSLVATGDGYALAWLDGSPHEVWFSRSVVGCER